MSKSRIMAIGAIVAILLTSLPLIGVQAQDYKGDAVVTNLPAVPPADVLGYFTRDGGKTWNAIKEQPGVAERIPTGTSIYQFMREHNIPAAAAPYLKNDQSPTTEPINGLNMSPLADMPPEYTMFYQDINYTGTH